MSTWNLAKDGKIITPTRIKVARAVALSADLFQIALFPLFVEGFTSPLDDALDLVVCLVLTLLIGWHYTFVPSFIAKLVPMVDLVPTWTVAVLIATRQGKGSRLAENSIKGTQS